MKQNADRLIKETFTKGAVFDGKYRIDELIGTGNFSHVFRARHESMGRDVALKILKPEMKKIDPELGVRFMNEVKIVSKLSHPNSVSIFDFGETNGIQYMVLEYIAGTDLDKIIGEDSRFPVKIGVDLVLQILSALKEAHDQNIIHRDLKPSNIMISKVKGKDDGQVKLAVKVLDFGVAKFVSPAQKKSDKPKRRSTRFIGTPAYMSPEQVLGQKISASSDLYSVGLILYEILTGDVPITAKNLAGVAQIHIDEAPIPFRKISQIPEHLQSVIFRATERFPEDRFSDAEEFSDALKGKATSRKTDDVDVSASTRAFFLSGQSSDLGALSTPPQSQQKPGRAKYSTNRLPAAGASPRVAKSSAQTPAAPKPSKAKPTVLKNEVRRRPAKKATLELDLEKVRTFERSKTQQNPVAQRPIQTGRSSSDWAIIGIGILTFLLSAGLAGAMLPTDSTAFRFAVSLSPIFFGILAISFSPMGRKRTDTLADGLVEPILQRSIPLFFAIVIVAFFVFPQHAASTCRDNATWFLPETLKDGVFGNMISFIGSLFASLFSLASKFLPW